MKPAALLIFTLLFFSVFIPCFCGVSAGENHDPCVMSGSTMTHGQPSAAGMNALEQISSWRAFFSVTVAVLLSIFFPGIFSRAFSKRFPIGTRAFSRFDVNVFHPPEYFDERVMFAHHLFRALYSGVLHAKVS